MALSGDYMLSAILPDMPVGDTEKGDGPAVEAVGRVEDGRFRMRLRDPQFL